MLRVRYDSNKPAPGGEAEMEENKVTSRKPTLINNIFLMIVAIICFVVIYFLMVFLTPPNAGGSENVKELLELLASPSVARGLITFLIVVVTVIMGLLLLISSLRTTDGADASFTRGKEVFAILVGILGTIVGYYFGVGADDNNDEKNRPEPTHQQQTNDQKPINTEQITSSANPEHENQ